MKKSTTIIGVGLALLALLLATPTPYAQTAGPALPDSGTAAARPDSSGDNEYVTVGEVKEVVDAVTDSLVANRERTKIAQQTANGAWDSVDVVAKVAHAALAKAQNAGYFKSRPAADALYDEALGFIVSASSDTSNPNYLQFKAIADRMAAGKSLTKEQKTFASVRYLAYVTKGAGAGFVALSTMDSKVAEAESRLTQTVRDTLATISDLKAQVAELKSALEKTNNNMVALAANTANALRAKDEEGRRASKDEARTCLERLRRFGRGVDTKLATNE